MKTKSGVFGVFLVAIFCVSAFGQSGPGHRADWMREAQWGVFCHYMADTVLKGQELTPELWNKTVEAFDVEGLADQLKSVGARYFVLTLGQNSGYYCSPNATYERIVGNEPSKCSTRDLPADLANALAKRGIRLMVYLPAGAPDRDEKAKAAFEWKPGEFPLWTYENGKPKGRDDRLVNFQNKWESVIREWSERWGKKVCGWWFDGCYYPDAMYRHDDAPNFASFSAAARAGNPDSAVAFNPGVLDPVITLTPEEDYTAGEISDPDKLVCPGPKVGAAQYQMLSYIGKWWCGAPPRFTPEQVAEMTQKITGKGGAVTWDVPPEASGRISEEFLPHLRAVGAALGTAR